MPPSRAPGACWEGAPGASQLPGNLAEASRLDQLMMPAQTPPCDRYEDGTAWGSECNREEKGREGKGREGKGREGKGFKAS